MALGSAIGTGLFAARGRHQNNGGSRALPDQPYIIGGGRGIYRMPARIGEMSVHNPAASSFSRYARENLGPRLRATLSAGPTV